jgi:hypothetical protein
VCLYEIKNAYKILVGKPEGKRTRGRPRFRWEDNKEHILVKQCGKMWTGLIWLKIGTDGRLLGTW